MPLCSTGRAVGPSGHALRGRVHGALQDSTLRAQMPKALAMAQLSRPFQIALAAAVAALGLFAMWSLVLHHSSSPEAGGAAGSTPAAVTSSPAAAASSASAPASPAHAGTSSSGTGEGGYGGAIEKAHGAVDESQQNARQLENRSAQASGEPVPAHTSATPGAQSSAAAASASKAVVGTSTAATSASKAGAGTSTAATSASKAVVGTSTAARSASKAAHQPAVHKQLPAHLNAAAQAKLLQETEQELLKLQLAQGKTVLLLFWDPKATNDVEVRRQLLAVAARQKGKVAVHLAEADQVGQYGAMTRNVQILQTPTLLIVGKKGLAVTLTGLVDQYAIEQSIQEAAKI
jgi:hypothetical protein